MTAINPNAVHVAIINQMNINHPLFCLLLRSTVNIPIIPIIARAKPIIIPIINNLILIFY